MRALVASLLALAVLLRRDVSAHPVPPRLLMKRHDCEDCPPKMQENQTVSYLCTMTPCLPDFSVGFYRVDYTGPVPIHTNSGLFPAGSSVNVAELEVEHGCGKVLTFVASAPLDGTVLQCIAHGFTQDQRLGSRAHVIAMEALPEPTDMPSEDPTIGCDCPTSCAGTHTEQTSASSSLYSSVRLAALLLSLIPLLMYV